MTQQNIQHIATLQGHKDRVWSVVFNPRNAHSLVTCSGDKSVRIWNQINENKWECTNVLEGAHTRTVRSIALAPNRNEIASAGFDSLTAIWEEEFNQQYGCIATLEGHENEVKSVAYSANGSLLATCSRDKSVWIWEVSPDGDFECLSVLQEHSQDVKMVIWHPFLDLLASASYDDTIKIWREDDDDWTCVATLEGHESTIWAIDFNKEGTHLVSVSDDRSIRIWNRVQVSNSRERWSCVQVIENAFERTIYSVSWNKDTPFGTILVGGADNFIRLYENKGEDDNINYYKCNEISNAHGIADINCVIWNKMDSNVFASAGDDYLVKIWRVNPSV